MAKKHTKSSERRRLEAYVKKLSAIRAHDKVDYQESKEAKEERIRRSRIDYAYFVDEFFPHYATAPCADFHIRIARKVKSDQRLRAVIEIFRGGAKSTHFDIFLPIWLHLFHGEPMFMVLVSQSEDHASRLLDDIRAELEANPQLIHHFGELKQQGSWEEGEFSTTTGAHFIARGKKSPARGLRKTALRPTLIILDDVDDDEEVKNPKRVRDSVKRIKKAIRLSQDIGIARFIIVNNRIAPLCILGEFASNPKYWHIKVNALDENGNPTWHQKYTKAYYDDLREELGVIDFNTELMNDPVAEGTIFKNEFFQYRKTLRLNQYDRIIAFWDVAYSEAKTADFNAVPVIGRRGNEKHLIGIYCRQSKPEEAVRWMRRFDMALPKTVTVEWYAEKQFYNDSVKQSIGVVAKEPEFRGHYFDLVFLDNPRTNKYSRIIRMLPDWQRREVYVNEELKHSTDYQEAEKQIKGIEPGYKSHDDAPDAFQQGMEMLQADAIYDDSEPEIGELTPSDKIY